jgi:hypothetical protein
MISRINYGGADVKLVCPQCQRVIEIGSKGSGRCECGAHIKVIDK